MNTGFRTMFLYLCIIFSLSVCVEGFLLHPSHFRSVQSTSSTSTLTKTASTALFVLNGDDLDAPSSSAYTQKQLLKEETEAPFRNVRIYFYFALMAAATLSGFICLTKIIALETGSTQEGDLNSLLKNLAINFGGIPVLAFLWKRDIDNRGKLLDRIQRGGSLAALKIKLNFVDGPQVVQLSDLRRDRGIEKRLVIVAAQQEALLSSVNSSIPLSDSLFYNDLIIVPLVVSGTDGTFKLSQLPIESVDVRAKSEVEKEENSKHIGIPLALPAWNDVIGNELKIALKQQPDALEKGKLRHISFAAYFFLILGI